jgi:hypothetical protein
MKQRSRVAENCAQALRDSAMGAERSGAAFRASYGGYTTQKVVGARLRSPS